MTTRSKELKKMMARKMAYRYHESSRPNNPNLSKQIAQDWFRAKVNKKALPRSSVAPSRKPSYRVNDPYRRLSIEEFEKKYGDNK